MLVDPDDQRTFRPLSAFPVESFTAAVNCVVAPTLTATVGGDTTTAATLAVTVTEAVPAFPLAWSVATIVTVPAATPRTTPVLSTAAMLVDPDDQRTFRPLSAFPVESFTAAVNCVVAPTLTATVGGDTTTAATLAVTVTEAVPAFPLAWSVATIVTVPAATPRTTPVLSTAAMLVDPDDQRTFRPLSAFPVESFTAAVNCVVAPTLTATVGGDTTTASIAGGLGATGPDPEVSPLPAQLIMGDKRQARTATSAPSYTHGVEIQAPPPPTRSNPESCDADREAEECPDVARCRRGDNGDARCGSTVGDKAGRSSEP